MVITIMWACVLDIDASSQIGEVARIVHYLKKHLVDKRISSVQVQEDNIVYGKVGTTASAFQAAMAGKTVVDARQQGKYFWLVMNSPPHPVLHLGMTGWIKFSNDDTSYYRPKKEQTQEWPPRFWKFIFKTEDDNEVAFIDARRLARIRLVDADGNDLRNQTPLKENGPDPVIDKGVLTLEWFTKKMRSKRVPVKALLLDQANISGVGNWVADEVLFQARIHPEQYSNTFSDEQLKTLHDSLMKVCAIACETLAESDRFPSDWLMKYRWDKGKKGEVNKLPTGEKIVHLKVGGRTSAIVPSLQKKTAAVAGDVSGTEAGDENGNSDGDGEEIGEAKVKGGKRKTAGKGDEEAKGSPAKKRSRTDKVKEEKEMADEDEGEGDDKAERQPEKAKGRGKKADGESRKQTLKGSDTAGAKASAREGSRRSGRLSGKTE